METKLLNFLAQNFKEKRLIFQDTGGEAPAGREAPAAAPAIGSAERRAAAAEASNGLDEDPLEGVNPPTEEPSDGSFKSQDVDGYHYTGNINNPQLNDIRRIASGVYAIGYQYEIYDGNKWIEFQPAWAATAAAAPAPDAAAAEQARELEAAKGRLTAAKEKVTTEKAKVTQDILRTKVKEELENGDDQLKDELAKIIIPDGFDAEIEANFKEVTDKLTAADSLTAPTEIDQKIQEAETALQDLTPEKYIEDRSEAIDKHKPLLALFDQLEAIAKEGTHAKAVLDEIRTAIIADLGTETDPATIPDKIKSDFSEKLAIAVVADTIEVTPEDFQAAIRFYKLGQYRVLNETHPKFKKNKEILDKFVAAKKEGKLNGITFDFFGSTNNVDHRLTKDVAWHQEKAAALTKILELNAAGRLEFDPPDTILTDSANVDLINGYIAAVRASTGYVELVTANKDKFLTGGTIFDLALRLQRAAEFKRFVEGKTELDTANNEAHTDIFTTDGTDKVELLHQDNNSDDAMSSGIKLGIAEPAAADTADDDAPAEPENAADEPTAAPEVQTNEEDHAYHIEPDGRLKVLFKGEDEPKYYTIEKPDNVELQPDVASDGKDQYIRFFVKGRNDGDDGWFEFENKEFESDPSNYPDFIYTATFDDNSKTITITATPVAPTTGNPIEALRPAAEILQPIDKDAFSASEKIIAEQESFEFVTLQDAETTIDQQGSKYIKSNEGKIGPADGYRFLHEQNPDYQSKVVDKLKSNYVEAVVQKLKEKKPNLDAAAETAFRAQAATSWDAQWEENGKNNYAVVPIAPTTTPEGGSREALQQRDRETTEALQGELTAAKTEIDALIQKLETTIETNGFLASTVAEKVDAKKAEMEATFEQVRVKLKEALDKTAGKDFLGAEAAYDEAERIITTALEEQTQADSAESFLSDESKAVIVEIRTKVEEKKPLVEAAFAEKLAAVQALEPAPAAAE